MSFEENLWFEASNRLEQVPIGVLNEKENHSAFRGFSMGVFSSIRYKLHEDSYEKFRGFIREFSRIRKKFLEDWKKIFRILEKG